MAAATPALKPVGRDEISAQCEGGAPRWYWAPAAQLTPPSAAVLAASPAIASVWHSPSSRRKVERALQDALAASRGSTGSVCVRQLSWVEHPAVRSTPLGQPAYGAFAAADLAAGTCLGWYAGELICGDELLDEFSARLSGSYAATYIPDDPLLLPDREDMLEIDGSRLRNEMAFINDHRWSTSLDAHGEQRPPDGWPTGPNLELQQKVCVSLWPCRPAAQWMPLTPERCLVCPPSCLFDLAHDLACPPSCQLVRLLEPGSPDGGGSVGWSVVGLWPCMQVVVGPEPIGAGAELLLDYGCDYWAIAGGRLSAAGATKAVSLDLHATEGRWACPVLGAWRAGAGACKLAICGSGQPAGTADGVPVHPTPTPVPALAPALASIAGGVDAGGVGLFATEPLAAGEQVFVERPWACVLEFGQDGLACDHCAGPASAALGCCADSGGADSGGAGHGECRVSYCSTGCRDESSLLYHRLLCRPGWQAFASHAEVSRPERHHDLRGCVALVLLATRDIPGHLFGGVCHDVGTWLHL